MVDRNSQSSKQPIKRLRRLRFSFTQRGNVACVACVACVAFGWKPGLTWQLPPSWSWSLRNLLPRLSFPSSSNHRNYFSVNLALHHYCSIIQLLLRTRRSVYAFMYMSHIIISGKAVQCAYISLRPTTGNRCRYYVGSNCNCNSTSVRRYCPTGCNECLHYPVNLATTIRARTLLGFLLENLNFYLLYLLLWPRKEL